MFEQNRCNDCGDCFMQCPAVEYTREQATRQIRLLKRGEAADILSSCITCIACNEFCTHGANPYDLICAMQEKHGVRLIPVSMLDGIEAIAAGMPNDIRPGAPGKPALSLCVMEPAYPPGITDSALFEGLTIIKGRDFYSGIVCLHAGFESRVKTRARQFIENLARLGHHEIIFMHNDCYVLAAKKAPEYGIAVPFTPVSIVQYMARYFRQNPGSTTPLGKKIAVQRPCISRLMPEEEPCLDEFFILIGAERCIRHYDRKNALCCGVGIAHRDPACAQRLAEKNIADAVSCGADAMVFLCPTCYRHLSPFCQKHGMASLFITDLGRMALGELPFGSRPWIPPSAT